mmetsp:Transcript_88181/g.251788  ORF Transcript_88181/g.251788 Transcript_88181/m.251788 type:complete len:137 (+) Transcript_88181:717-1127(+)
MVWPALRSMPRTTLTRSEPKTGADGGTGTPGAPLGPPAGGPGGPRTARLEAGALFLQGHAAPRPVVASAVLRAAELPSADPHQALEVVPPFRALRVPEAGLVEAVLFPVALSPLLHPLAVGLAVARKGTAVCQIEA